MQVSHKLVYIADKVINPIDDTQLLNLARVKTALGGKGLFSFAAIKLSTKNTVLQNVDASTSSNFSSSKGIQPNIQLFFMGVESILNKGDLAGKEFSAVNQSLTPANVIKFNSTLNDELVFIPQPSKNQPSILEGLTSIYTTSFTDRFEKESSVYIPSQTKYLLVFPLVSMPIPIPRNPDIIRFGNIKVSVIVNFEINEV